MKHLKLFFALFAMLALGVGNAWGAEWEKVTSAPADWSGEYLLVYESGTTANVWTGVDAASCYTQGTISSNKITGDFVSLTIATMTGGYSIKVNGGTNNGKYIYGTSGSNKINFGTTAKANTLTYESNSTKIVSNTSVMRYNPQTGNLRFRYFKSSSYSSQKAVQLYKKVEQSEGGAVTEDLGDALKWSAATATVQVGADDNVFPTLTNDKTVAVAYTSSSTDVATIDANGEVTLVKEGTTTISAYYEGGEIDGVTYSAKNVSYTLTVKPAPLVIEPIEGGIIDILTHKTFAATSNQYTNFTGKQAANENHSEAVYAGRSARNGNATQYSIQLNTIDKGRIATTTSGGIAKRVYVKWSTQPTLNTNARALNIYGSNDAFLGSETANPSTEIGTITFTTGAAEAYVDLEGDYKHILITANGAIYMDEIQVTWVVAEGTVTTPTISGTDEFIESTEVTIVAEDGLKVYYTLDGTDPTNASTEYTAPFELTATTTVKAVAYDGEKASDIISKTFKKLQVLTCEEAAELALSVANNNDLVSDGPYVFRGFVTEIAYKYQTGGTMSVWMADTKNGGNVMQAYRFTPEDGNNPPVVGDYLQVVGELTKYNTIPESAAGAIVTKYPAPVTYDYYIAGTENLTGFNWSANGLGMEKDGDVYKHTFRELNSGIYQFKITDGQFNSEGDNTHEHTTLGAAYKEVSYNDGNIQIITEEAINLTVIFDATADKITFEGLTPKYTVEATVNPAEVGTIEGADSYSHGTEVTLTATANDHYVFVNWTAGEEVVSTENPYMFTITADVDLVANFKLDTHTINATATNGTVTGAGTYNHGEEVTLTATPAEGYHFEKWSNESTENPLTITVTEDVELQAIFAINVYDVTAIAENGTVTGAGEYAHGTEVTLTATPDFDYEFVKWSNESTENPLTITVTDNETLEAIFAEVAPTEVKESGVFSISAHKTATFATGNLQHNVGTGEWRFAKQQYQVVGEQNINLGDPAFSGWIDMLGWSNGEANNYGVNASNVNELYDGEFVDWGTKMGAEWSTLSADDWKYLLNTREAAATLKQIAKVGDILGLLLFPDGWVMPGGCTVEAEKDEYFNVNIYNYTIDQWNKMEATGAVFLPAAGRRTGGYGNMINYDQEEETDEEMLNGGYYRHQDNTNIYCYYWTSTINEETKNVSYLHNIVALGNDKYTIGTGAIWGEKGRYGQSVRLAKVAYDKHTVTAIAENGTVTGADADEYTHGTEITLTAIPAEHYVFVNWTAGETVLSTENPYIFTLEADVELKANFALDTHTITATAENGTVTGDGEYTHGTEVTLTATPAEGYEFVNWTAGETVFSTENPYKFTVTADVVLVANFTPTLPTEIKISGEATHTEYNFGEQFDVTGLVVTAVYSDKEVDITEQVEWTMSPLTIGTTAVEVKVTYGTFSATKTCNVTVHVPHNKVTTADVLDGIFLVSDTKAVKFSAGNLQYNCGTYTWSFAEEQYEIIGGEAYDGTNNTNYGMNVPGYTGKLDLFAWSCESSKYGVNPSNTDADYTGAFVDWGTLVEETGWYTLTQAEMQYLLNQKKDGKALWTFASIEGIKGLMLMPYNWDVKLNNDIEYGYAPKDFSAEFEHNVFTAEDWVVFQGSGAAFLPTAGSRTGGYGNTENAGVSNQYDENGHYFHVDNVNDYGYYWLNTEDSRDGYQHCASYLIFPGWSDNELKDDESDDFNYGPTIWSREKRRGNSVRLVKETTRPADAPTDILNLETGIAPQKIFMNGQLIIIKNGVQYNAQGQVVK